jgi:hypothetical protein
MSVHLNDLSKVYLQQVVENNDDSYLETDMNKRRSNNEKAIEDMKKTKANKDMVDAVRKKFNEALDPVGQEDSDIDNDGTPNDKNDKYISKRRKAVARAIAKKKVSEAVHATDNKIHSSIRTKTAVESFSNWRHDLREVIDSKENNKGIKEKKVDNKIVINPEIKEEIHILESLELSEEYVNETVNCAVDYFFAEGLNHDGVEILIDELGLDEFVSFVFEIGNEVLSEARAGGVRVEPVTKGGKSVGSLKGGAKTAAINRLRKEKQARREAESSASSSKPSGFKSFSQKHAAVKTAKQQQPSKKPVRDAIARGVFGAVKAYQAGMQRHKAAMNLAKETGKTVAKAAAVTHEAGRRAGQSKIGQAVKKAGSAAIKAGVEKAKKDIKSLKKEEVEVDEAVYGGTPAKKEEPKDTRYTVTAADKRGNTTAYQNYKKGDKRYKAADHLGERTLTKDEMGEKEDYVKGMKKSKKSFKDRYGDRWKEVMYATATKMAKEETQKPSALDIVKQQVIAKHGAASIMGTPENKAATEKRAKEAAKKPQPKPAKRYEDDVYSKDGLGGIRGYRSGD